MNRIILIPALVASLAAPLAAQVALPGVPLPRVGDVLRPVTDTLDDAARLATDLARDRLRMIDRLVRSNRDIIERDAAGDPARKGELLVMDADTDGLAKAEKLGFVVIEHDDIEGLGVSVTRVRTPGGMALAKAQALLAETLPDALVSADNLHFQSGRASGVATQFATAASGASSSAEVGMIDGASGASVPVIATRGFASGAPYPSNHGSAIVSLLRSAGVTKVRVADVYGTDKAGGNALAIARGLGWLVGQGSDVVTISLVGPRNPVLERAIAAAQRKGVVVVAAVGNDGPAAPPAYPASYDGVVAVTAVDGKRRALIEAGKALHLDYAAPGADISGLNAKGKRITLRGTSFATPLVAARIARAGKRDWRGSLDAEAIDLGRRGADETYGRGLVCASCKGR